MTKYIKLFEDIVNLDKYIKNERIPDEIVENAEYFVSKLFKNSNIVPRDIKDKKNIIKLWFCREFRKWCLQYSSFNSLLDGDTKHLLKPFEKYLKGYPETNPDYIKAFKEEIERSFDAYLFKVMIDYFLSPVRTDKLSFSNVSIDDYVRKSNEFHNEIAKSKNIGGKIKNESGNIIKKYDDGYYWIDLGKSSCEKEARYMGHCGNGEEDTLLSLRRDGIPHITISANYIDILI